MTPVLLVLSSPSGGGKTTIARLLLQGRTDIGYSVSATTRPKRPKEQDGVDYHFLSREEFLGREAAGEFIEHASYNGHLYGTLRSEVARVLDQGRHVILDIEVQGARQVRAKFPDSIHVFLLPPSAAVLAERLADRNTEQPGRLRERLCLAAEELTAVTEYDYVVVNDELFAAVAHVAAILDAEGRRVRRQPGLSALIEQLRRGVLAEAARFAE